MSESGQFSDSSNATDFEDDEEEEDEIEEDEYSLGNYYDEDEEYNDYYEDYSDIDDEYNTQDLNVNDIEDFSDDEPEIVYGKEIVEINSETEQKRKEYLHKKISSKAWDLTIVLLAFCVAILFGYYTVV